MMVCCNPVGSRSHDRDVSAYMIAIHGRDKKDQDELDLTTRLQAIINIVKKM